MFSLTKEQIRIIQLQFYKFCSVTVFRDASYIKKQDARIAEREIALGFFEDDNPLHPATTDNYDLESTKYVIANWSTLIENGQIEEGLNKLTDTQRNVVLLYYVLDFNDREISEILKIPRQTVNSARYAALNKLRRHLEEQ